MDETIKLLRTPWASSLALTTYDNNEGDDPFSSSHHLTLVLTGAPNAMERGHVYTLTLINKEHICEASPFMQMPPLTVLRSDNVAVSRSSGIKGIKRDQHLRNETRACAGLYVLTRHSWLGGAQETMIRQSQRYLRSTPDVHVLARDIADSLVELAR